MSVAVTVATEFVLQALIQLAKSSALIRAVQAEGRTTLSEMEWREIIETNDEARADAQDAVDNAIIQGR